MATKTENYENLIKERKNKTVAERKFSLEKLKKKKTLIKLS